MIDERLGSRLTTRTALVKTQTGQPVIGSLNGGEVSAKLNREVALLVGSDAAYAYLADGFWYDWSVTP